MFPPMGDSVLYWCSPSSKGGKYPMLYAIGFLLMLALGIPAVAVCWTCGWALCRLIVRWTDTHYPRRW